MLHTRYNIIKRDFNTLCRKGFFVQHGGMIPTHQIADIKSLPREWMKVVDNGQHNCGIYVNPANKNRIIKCVRREMSENNYPIDVRTQEINRDIGFHIFPEIYNYYKITNEPSRILIEMERFDNDVTYLLMEYLPHICARSMGLDQQIETDLLNILWYKMPSTNYNPRFDIVYPLNQKVDEPSVKNDKCDKFVEEFANSMLTLSIYNEFMKIYIEALNLYLPMINEQIFVLQYRLLKIGYRYFDNKFDNYAFTFADENIEYMGVQWGDRNRIGDKYFFLHIIDWDSGLEEVNKEFENYYVAQILRYYIEDNATYMGVHGQYSVRLLNRGYVDPEITKLLNDVVPSEIIQILQLSVTYTVVPEKKPHFNNIDDAMTHIMRKPIDLHTIISKSLGENFAIQSIDDMCVVLIKSGSGRNNSLKIDYDVKQEEYMITCLDDKKRMARTTNNWPVGIICTRDINILVGIIRAIYY